MPVSFRAARQTSAESPPHPKPPSSRSIPHPHTSVARRRASPPQSHPPPAQSRATPAPLPPPPCDPRGSSTAQSLVLSSGQASSKQPTAAPFVSRPSLPIVHSSPPSLDSANKYNRPSHAPSGTGFSLCSSLRPMCSAFTPTRLGCPL